MSDSRFLRGTFILSASAFISKFLGMIYVFPLYALIGSEGTALITYAYIPYSILISMATMGVPLAVSKFVSKYNTLGDYQTGRSLFKSGLLLMTVTGMLAFLLLYSLAPVLAPVVIGDNDTGNSLEDVTYVLRMVSVALIIVPMMSLIRGFFQGYQYMEPTAVSQVIEQVVRIVFILAGAFLVLKVFGGEIITAVGFATFAAFIGAIAGLAVLGWFWLKKKDYLNKLLDQSENKADISTKEMYRELLSYAGPFVFVGLAIPLYQLIDQFSFNRAMVSADKQAIAEVAFQALNFSSHKLVMIPVSLATAFALTLIPAVTKSFTDQNFQVLHKQISQTLQVVMLLILPAVIGLSTVAYPAYAAFFDIEEANLLGGQILRWYAPVALLFALYTVTAAILQGINQQRFAVVSLFVGLAFKLLLNFSFVQWFGAIGSVITTTIGYTSAVIINLYIIKKHTQFQYTLFLKRTLLIVIFVTAMTLVVVFSKGILSTFLTYEDGRGQAFLILIISVTIGALFYLWLCIRSSLVSKILGDRLAFLKRRKKAVQ